MLNELRNEVISMQVAARRGWPTDRSAIKTNIETQGLAQAATLLKPPAMLPTTYGLFGWTRSLFGRR